MRFEENKNSIEKDMLYYIVDDGNLVNIFTNLILVYSKLYWLFTIYFYLNVKKLNVALRIFHIQCL